MAYCECYTEVVVGNDEAGRDIKDSFCKYHNGCPVRGNSSIVIGGITYYLCRFDHNRHNMEEIRKNRLEAELQHAPELVPSLA